MSNPFIGEIRMFGFNFAPRFWATCDGQILPIAQNTALFALLGTTYGGNGTTTFALPDLRGRFPMHFGNGPGLTQRQIGERSGFESSTLTTANLPAHTHPFTAAVAPPCSSQAGNADTPVGKVPAASATAENYGNAPGNGSMASFNISGTTGASGSGAAFPIIPPYLVINFCIALSGIFPSRA